MFVESDVTNMKEKKKTSFKNVTSEDENDKKNNSFQENFIKRSISVYQRNT